MALIAFDGFDHYNSGADLLARTGDLQYTSAGNGSFTTGRNGNGKAVVLTNILPLEAVLPTQYAAGGCGAAIKLDGASCVIRFIDSRAAGASAVQCSIKLIAANYSIAFYRGDLTTLLWQSPNNTWADKVWNFVETWPTIDNATGAILLHLNGEEIENLTGVDTQTSGNAWYDVVSYQLADAIGLNGVLDDAHFCDTTSGPGTFPCDSPLGDLRVYTAFPIGNASVQWTPLALTNWQELAETAMDSDASYNFSNTAGQEDRINFAALGGTVNHIVGVQITGAYRKDDATPRTLKQGLQSNVTTGYGTTRPLPDTSPTYFTDLFVLDPDTLASWDLPGVNGLAGVYNLVS